MKRCWQCAEEIQDAAIVCPYCRVKQWKQTAAKPPEPPTPAGQSLSTKGAIIIAGCILVTAFFIAGAIMKKPPSEPAASAPAAVVAKATPEPSGPSSYKVEILATRKLKSSMRDPDSMETRNVHVPPGAAFLCGEVNGANAFGGKTGFKRFIVGATSAMPSVIEGDGQMKQSEFEDAWRRLC